MRKLNVVLWIVQLLLALVFLFAGYMKLVLPVADMTQEIALPGWFLRFIAVAEVLGAMGLILPWVLRIKPGLTPLAAACLTFNMIGATVITLMLPNPATAVIPLLTGLLCAFVAYGRSRLTPYPIR